MRDILIVDEGRAYVDSRRISAEIGVEHRSFYRLLRDHREVIERTFGRVRFEITPFETAGGVQSMAHALLDEDQATFAISLSKNTERVVLFKAALVKAFSEAKKRLAGGPAIPGTYAEALRLAASQAEENERLMIENSSLLREVEEMEPKATFFDCAMTSKQGMLIRDAAKLLHPSVKGGMGEKRLFQWMRDNGWLMTGNRPYQTRVDAGHMTMTERPVPTSSGTIIKVTPRVTQKGLALLHSKFDANNL